MEFLGGSTCGMNILGVSSKRVCGERWKFSIGVYGCRVSSRGCGELVVLYQPELDRRGFGLQH
jgi:hypothetical protein